MLSKAALIATATAIASIKGVTAKRKDSSRLSGIGYDACHINPEATAVINGGTCDARNIVARDNGYDIHEGAYGVFVDVDATATVCDARIIKGGTQIDGGTWGRGAVYVASGATLNIADGLIEGGDTTDVSYGSYGIYASYEANEKPSNVVITGGEILGGMRNSISTGNEFERGESIFLEAGGTVTVYGGDIGDESTYYSLAFDLGEFGDLPTGNNVATVSIYGGKWYGDIIRVNAYANNSKAYLYIFGKDLEETPLQDNEVSVKGRLCDGSKFEQTIGLNTANSGIAELYVNNDCSSFVVPTFDDCGKKKRSGIRL